MSPKRSNRTNQTCVVFWCMDRISQFGVVHVAGVSGDVYSANMILVLV